MKSYEEQLKMLLGRDDYQAMLKLRLSDPSLQSFETNLVDTAKSLATSCTVGVLMYLLFSVLLYVIQ